jgi:uncharacterized protein (DUF2336 family)
VSANAFIREIEDQVALRPLDERVGMLGKIIDLLRAQAASMPKLHLDVFDAVIQRLAAEIALAARVELAERLAPMQNAPEGIVRLLAHDQVPVATPIISHCARLQPEDLVSVAASRGQDHMGVVASRPDLPSDVTDILVLRGDTKVLKTLARNESAALSDVGLTALLHRARDDEALKADIAMRGDLAELDIDAILAQPEFVEAARHRLRRETTEQRLKAALDVSIEALIEEAEEVSEATTDADEAEVERLIAENRLDDAAIAQFAADKRVRALTLSLAHLGAVELHTAEKLMTKPDPKMLIFLLRGHNMNWSTTRAVISARPAPLPNMAEMQRYMDVFNQTTPDVAKKVFTVRAAR